MALLPEDPEKRKQVLLGLVMILAVAYAAYTYLYQPRVLEANTLQERLDALQAQNETARALARGIGAEDAQQRLVLYREQLSAVEALVPSSEELPDLLDAISAEAQRTGVELSLIQPSGAEEEQYYTRRIYDLAVLGTYHQIGKFLTQIASLPRIITPQGLTLTPQETAAGREQRLEARFSVETYVLPAGMAPGEAAVVSEPAPTP